MPLKSIRKKNKNEYEYSRELRSYQDKSARTILYISLFLVTIGNILDGIVYFQEGSVKLYFNIAALLILHLVLFLHLLNAMQTSSSFAFVAYTVIANHILSTAVNLQDEMNVSGFMRDSMFTLVLLTLVAYMVDKRHAIVIGLLFFLQYIIMTILTKNDFLVENAPLMIAVSIGYSIGIYAFVKARDDAIIDSYKNHQKVLEQKEEIQTQNNILIQQQEEISAQRDNLLHQSEIIRLKNVQTENSLKFAKRIQDSMLPSNEDLSKLFKDYFVIYRPKDIVSGDFYWGRKKGDQIFIAVVDCTGHGVPGALVSMIGNLTLNSALDDYDLNKPSEILDKANELILQKESKDRLVNVQFGMDISLISINYETRILEFAGAFNSVYLLLESNLIKVKADPFPIGFVMENEFFSFSNHQYQFIRGDQIFLSSDGYTDQFGGPDDKKFGIRKFRKLLSSNHHLPMHEQKSILIDTFENWKKHHEQLDDVLVMGIRL